MQQQYIELREELLFGIMVSRTLKGRMGRFPMVTTYNPAFSSIVGVVKTLHPLLMSTEEHRKVFLELPFIAIRRCKNLRNVFVSQNHVNLDHR